MSETAASSESTLQPQSIEQVKEGSVAKEETAKAKEETSQETTDKTDKSPTDEPKEEAPKDEDFSKKLNWLAKKERKLQEERAAAKALKEELEAVRKENETFKQWKESLKKSPLKALKDEGLSFEDLTAQALTGDRENDRLLALQTEMESLKGELGNYRKLNEEKEKAAQEAQEKYAIDAFKAQIGSFLETSEKHELIRAFQANEEVYNLIETQYEETGRLLSVDEAADLLESYLEQKVEEDAGRLTKTNKFKSKLAAKFSIEPPKAETTTAKAEPKERATLTNQTISPPRVDRELTKQERLKAAAELLRYTE